MTGLEVPLSIKPAPSTKKIAEPTKISFRRVNIVKKNIPAGTSTTGVLEPPYTIDKNIHAATKNKVAFLNQWKGPVTKTKQNVPKYAIKTPKVVGSENKENTRNRPHWTISWKRFSSAYNQLSSAWEKPTHSCFNPYKADKKPSKMMNLSIHLMRLRLLKE